MEKPPTIMRRKRTLEPSRHISNLNPAWPKSRLPYLSLWYLAPKCLRMSVAGIREVAQFRTLLLLQRPNFRSQQPYFGGLSQPPVTPTPGNSIPFSGLRAFPYIHMNSTNKINLKKNKMSLIRTVKGSCSCHLQQMQNTGFLPWIPIHIQPL